MRKLAHCFGKNAVNQLKTLVSVAGYEPTSNSEFDRKAGSPAEQASIAERCRPSLRARLSLPESARLVALWRVRCAPSVSKKE